MYKQFLMYYNGIINKNRRTFKELLKNETFVLFFVIMISLLIFILYLDITRNEMGVIILSLVFILVAIVCTRCDSRKKLKNYVNETKSSYSKSVELFKEICKEMNIKNNNEFKELIDAFDYKIKYGYIENNTIKYALISTISSVIGIVIGKIADFTSIDPKFSVAFLIVILSIALIVFFIFLLVQAISKIIEYKLYNDIHKDQLIELRDNAILIYNKNSFLNIKK